MTYIKNILAAVFLVLSMPALTACSSMGFIERPPAPLAQTQIDDNAVKLGYHAADLALDAINGLVDVGLIKPGSSTANKIVDAIDVVRSALNTADNARKAGQSGSYQEAMENVREGMIELRILFAKVT